VGRIVCHTAACFTSESTEHNNIKSGIVGELYFKICQASFNLVLTYQIGVGVAQ
jgi:hypothetical protein